MPLIEKVCPIVVRIRNSRVEFLAFVHPSAGRQIVKGTIEKGEAPIDAAQRELREESGLVAPTLITSIGIHQIGMDRQRWHFFKCVPLVLPETWQHRAEDDFGHTFTFFWQPLDAPMDETWHPIFREAYRFFASRLA